MAVIDLSQLPAPQIVDVPDFETLLAERKAEFVALHPKDEQEAVMRTLELESEPVTKLLQENAYRELLLRQRINEAAQAVMVAYAIGSDLDQLAANYNVKRLTVTPADNDAVPPVAAVMESDEALRLRVPAAFEGLSVAGPTAAYEFHARSADGRVADASATSPAPAEVVLTVLSREGDGTAVYGAAYLHRADPHRLFAGGGLAGSRRPAAEDLLPGDRPAHQRRHYRRLHAGVYPGGRRVRDPGTAGRAGQHHDWPRAVAGVL